MVGACIGFVGIIGVRVLVLGDSFDGLHSKFAETGMLETVGVSLLAILILLFSIFLQVLLHEGGHLVCGLATGYRFVSFRIFNLTFIRKDGKLCIKRFSLAGTGGQCLLTPPERPLEDIPTTLYNLGGVLANLLTAILAFLPLLTVDGLPYLLKFFLLMLSLIGIYNPQIQISAESETKRSIFREKDKTKRSKKESAQHSKSRNKSFVMTSVSAL